MFVGVDIVKNKRFDRWFLYSDAQLARVFHSQEITEFRELFIKKPEKAAIYLASRYAVKEAFFKAYSAWREAKNVESKPFLFISSRIFVQKNQKNIPQLTVDELFICDFPDVSVSLSHEECCSVAVVRLD